MTPFCNLFMERPSYFTQCATVSLQLQNYCTSCYYQRTHLLFINCYMNWY